MDTVFYGFLSEMNGENLIGHKYYARHLNKKILKYFSGSSSTTNELDKIMCNSIHELFNVFENPARHVYILHIVCHAAQNISVPYSQEKSIFMHM